MNKEIRWLVQLGPEHNLFDLDQAAEVGRSLGEAATLMAFAQKLIDDGIVSDEVLETLEKIAGQAMARARTGPPDTAPSPPSSPN